MEMRRLGLAKKPMIVVPNHLVEQWGAAFLALYPQANTLRRRQGPLRRRQPAEGHVAHRHRQL
jgi:N12 class adenine-specific DNA methylase